jgi:hypothetical protein
MEFLEVGNLGSGYQHDLVLITVLFVFTVCCLLAVVSYGRKDELSLWLPHNTIK